LIKHLANSGFNPVSPILQSKHRSRFMERIILIIVFTLAHGFLGYTQGANYHGYRLSLHRFTEVKTIKQSLTFNCTVINTGRERVSFSKSKPPKSTLVFELDTLTLPSPLKGRNSDIFLSLSQNNIELDPGQSTEELKLTIPLTAKGQAPKPKKEQKTMKDIAKEANTGTDYIDYESSCPDLVIDTAYIVETTKNNFVIKFIARNIGGATARLLGKTDAETDNIALNVYFNRGIRLTRGALLGDGMFIQEGKETQNGLLFPNGRLYGEIQVPRDRHSKFAPNIILEIDPFSSILECDKTNNIYVIKMVME
jgi:hypothetical protein